MPLRRLFAANFAAAGPRLVCGYAPFEIAGDDAHGAEAAAVAGDVQLQGRYAAERRLAEIDGRILAKEPTPEGFEEGVVPHRKARSDARTVNFLADASRLLPSVLKVFDRNGELAAEVTALRVFRESLARKISRKVIPRAIQHV